MILYVSIKHYPQVEELMLAMPSITLVSWTFGRGAYRKIVSAFSEGSTYNYKSSIDKRHPD